MVRPRSSPSCRIGSVSITSKLQRVARRRAGSATELRVEAAEHYGQAYRHHETCRAVVAEGEPGSRTLQERLRTAERIAAIVPPLERGIAAEEAGREALRRCLTATGG